jgi:hypothetical protein
MVSSPGSPELVVPEELSRPRRALGEVSAAVRNWRFPDPGRAAGAVVLSASAGTWAVALRPGLAPLLVPLGIAGVVAVAGGVLACRFLPVTIGIGLLGAAYVSGQHGRPVSVIVAAAFGSVLLAITELAWWSAELSTRSVWDRSVKWQRWLVLAGLWFGGFAVAVVAGLVAVAKLAPSLTVVAAGAISALLLSFVVVSWVRRLVGGR